MPAAKSAVIMGRSPYPSALARSPKQKARRGELLLAVAVGYLKAPNDRIEKDPDRRVQNAIALVFTKFTELQTVR
jgi:hypothetical protein